MSIYSAERLKIVSTDKKVLVDNKAERTKLENKKANRMACPHCGTKLWRGKQKHRTVHTALCPTANVLNYIPAPEMGDGRTKLVEYNPSDKFAKVREYRQFCETK